MTPDAVDQLLAYLASAGVIGRLEETSPEVWEDGLTGISDSDAEQAVRQLVRTHRWVKIADVVEAVAKIRDDRVSQLHGPGQFAEIPDADPDDVEAYLAAVRAQRTRAALSGELKHRPALEAAIEDFGPRIPGPDAPRPGPLGKHCPNCYSPIGRPCRTPGGKERAAHQARRAAAGVPGVDHPLPPDQAAAEEHRRRQAARIHLAAMGGDQ